MQQNVDVIQLSTKTTVVAMNKYAIAALKDGGAQVVKLKVGKRELQILFMRDQTFREKMKDFRNKFKDEDNKTPKFITKFFQRFLGKGKNDAGQN